MDNGVLAGLLAALAGFSILGIVWYVLQVIAYWKIFTKAGRPGWKSIIPFLNVYEQFDLSWKGLYGILLMVFCIVGSWLTSTQNSFLTVIGTILVIAAVVIGIIGTHKLSKAFGHGIGFTLGLIFLGPIFMLILGFGKSTYQGPQ